MKQRLLPEVVIRFIEWHLWKGTNDLMCPTGIKSCQSTLQIGSVVIAEPKESVMICPKKMEGIIMNLKESLESPDELSGHLQRWYQCEKEKCAWWIKAEGSCAIRDLATSLDLITRKP